MGYKRGCCTIIYLIYVLIISVISLVLSIIPWVGAWTGYFVLYSGFFRQRRQILDVLKNC